MDPRVPFAFNRLNRKFFLCGMRINFAGVLWENIRTGAILKENMANCRWKAKKVRFREKYKLPVILVLQGKTVNNRENDRALYN